MVWLGISRVYFKIFEFSFQRNFLFSDEVSNLETSMQMVASGQWFGVGWNSRGEGCYCTASQVSLENRCLINRGLGGDRHKGSRLGAINFAN